MPLLSLILSYAAPVGTFLMRRAIPLLLRREVILVVLAIALGFWIYHKGYDAGHARATAAAEAQAAELRVALAERGDALSEALLALETERRDRAAETERLEDDAREDDGADRLALPADSVRRLRSRWTD